MPGPHSSSPAAVATNGLLPGAPFPARLRAWLRLPAALWARVVVLFLILASLKLVLVAGLSRELFETHWRVPGPPVTWVNHVAFGLFIVLGVISLAVLGWRCQGAGVRAVRTANATIVALGLCFIFLTFHNGNKNYLYPLLCGTLKWPSLGPYLMLDFFFRAPFLAGWLLGYGAAYYLLVRTNRETWTPYLTALCAGAYGLLYLPPMLGNRDALLIADSLGLVSLLAGLRSTSVVAQIFNLLYRRFVIGWPFNRRRPLAECKNALQQITNRRFDAAAGGRRRDACATLRLGWLMVPLGWSVFFACVLLRFDLTRQGMPYVYFTFLWITSLALFGAATLLARRQGFLAPWSQLVFFYFTAFLLLVNANYSIADNYNNLLCLALAFPRYLAGELVVAALLAWGAALAYRAWLWGATKQECRRRRAESLICPDSPARLETPHVVSYTPRTCSAAAPSGSLVVPIAPLCRGLDLLNLLLIAVALVDLRLSQILGVRLEWSVLAFGNSPKMMWRMARPYLPGALAGLATVATVYFLALWAVSRLKSEGRNPMAERSPEAEIRSPSMHPVGWLRRGLGFRVSGFGLLSDFGLRISDFTPIAAMFIALSALGLATAPADKAEGQAGLRLVQTSPLWVRMANRTLAPEEFRRTARALGLGMGELEPAASSTPTAPPRDLNVVLVFQESSYNQYLSLFGGSEDTQPLLAKYKERMEVFPNFFSDFTGSIHARFATFTSLYPIRDFAAFTLHRVEVKSVFEVLHDGGYTCSLFYSSFFEYTGFGDFLRRRGLDEMYDADTMPGCRNAQRVSWGLCEEETLRAIRSQIKKYASDRRRFFLTYVPAAPHYPYENIPKRFSRYQRKEMQDYTPLYLNELLYMDWVIASILDELKESGLLDQTLVIITNDHGEQLGAHGGPIGHGWAVTPELVNTPLILLDPGHPGWRVNHTVGSQIDLLPTILDRLNLPIPRGQLYQGRSLGEIAGSDAAGAAPSTAGAKGAGANGAARTPRLIYLNSYRQFGIISGQQLIIGDRQQDRESPSDPKATAYTISNQGAKTLFTAEPAAGACPPSIREFDEFQESLLRNYSTYVETLRKSDQSPKAANSARNSSSTCAGSESVWAISPRKSSR